MRVVVIVFGVILAAAGGALAYRSYFVDPRTTVVIADAAVRELPNLGRVGAGLLLLAAGAALALSAALRRR